MFKRKEKPSIYFTLLFLIIPFILQSGGSVLQKHFAFMFFILALPAGYSLNYLIDKISYKKVLMLLLIIISLVSLIYITYGTPGNFLTSSATSQLKSYISENVDKSDFVVVDERIYTAQSFWLATDNHFLSMTNFLPVLSELQNSGQQFPITDVYFIECAIDDCGWGSIAQQTELNQTLEEAFQGISSAALDKKDIFQKDSIFGEKQKIYTVYHLKLAFPAELLNEADLANSFYFTPYLYKNKGQYLFNYSIYSSTGNILSKLSYYVILLSILLSFIYVFYVIYLTKKSL